MNRRENQPVIDIYYRPVPQAGPQLLRRAFPQRVLSANSTYFNGQVSEATTTNVTIVGGVPNAHVAVLKWMLATSVIEQTFKRIEKMPFSSYATILESAEILGIPRLAANIAARMERIAQGQIPSDDAEVIYNRYGEQHKWRWAVAENIAKAIWHGNLKYPERFEQLFREKPALKKDVDVCLKDPEVSKEVTVTREMQKKEKWNGNIRKAEVVSLQGEGAARWATVVAGIKRDTGARAD